MILYIVTGNNIFIYKKLQNCFYKDSECPKAFCYHIWEDFKHSAVMKSLYHKNMKRLLQIFDTQLMYS